MVQKEEIVKMIEIAFKDVKLDGGFSLEQTKVIDNYGKGVSTEQFVNLPNGEVTNDWRKIPLAVLDDAACIAHLDEKGFKYYIPALMLRLLNNCDRSSMMTIGTLGFLYPKKESHEYLYKELNEEQHRTIALYLKDLPNLIDLDTTDKTIVTRALRNYWSKFLPLETN